VSSQRFFRHLRQALPVAATVLVVGACGGQQSSPDATNEAPVSRFDLPIPAEQIGVAYSVTAWGDGFVAVGEAGDRAAVWSSDDARSWRSEPSASVSDDAAAEREAMLAVASNGTSVVAGGYIATDGRRAPAIWSAETPKGPWDLRPVASYPGEVHGLAIGAGRTIVGGEQGNYDDADAEVWIGEKGRWRSLSDRDLRGAGRQVITGIASTSRGFVAVGSDAGATAVWESPDGEDWRQVSVPASTAQKGELAAVAAREDVVVAVGFGTDSSIVWRSSEPGHWEQVSRPGARLIDRRLSAVTSSAEFLAAGFINDPQGDPNAWIAGSESGISWSPLPSTAALGGTATQAIHGAASGIDSVVFAGADYWEGPRPVIWTLDLE
jgi:hypothetical protein